MSGIPAGAGQLLGKRLGKFEILALLALGGTAEIYLARIGGAAGFEKYVVVKCLHDHLADDAEFVKMFLDEARLAAHLDHSNIVQTMELGQHDGRYYMVMEFLAGLSLAMIVRRAAERLPNARIPVPLVLNILAQSCAGLHYAHEKAMNGKPLNIVHRDISPQNLVISFEGVVKLVDFGIAKAELRETRTRSGTIKGKFAYMSPEQCVANNVDRRTDVFALGVIGHELLSGHRLFKRPSPYETYQAVIECDARPPSAFDPTIDPAIDAVIMRAITKDKDDRYPTAEAFGDALLGYLHHRGIGSGPGDVSRFFDAYFGQELEEHSGRMRELISGRELAVDTGVHWGGEDADDDGQGAATHDRDGEARGPRAGSVARALDDLGGGSRVQDDDEMPAEPTRIESNPLERINELDRLAAKAPPPRVSRSGRQPPSSAVPVPAPPPATSSPPGMPPSGRFPDLANLPTMISAEDAGVPAASDGFATAPTSLAPARVPAAPEGFGHPPGRLAAGRVPPAEPGFANAPTGPAPPPSAFADAPTSISPSPFLAAAQTQIAPRPPGASEPRGNGAPRTAPPPGYPVMTAELSEQIATGATVFPSDGRGGAFQGGAPGAPGPPPYPGAEPPGYPDTSPPGGRDPGFPGPPPGGPVDPQRAASLMSPVGQHYPQAVDWAVAAASRARAVPPWLLGILFLGAIGVALALTVVIARVIR